MFQDTLAPTKLYLSIGEVSRQTGVPPYVLRFWEREFTYLHPVRGPGGRRLYRQADMEKILYIKELLYHQGYSIKGAKQHWETEHNRPSTKPLKDSAEVEPLLNEIEERLTHIAQWLAGG